MARGGRGHQVLKNYLTLVSFAEMAITSALGRSRTAIRTPGQLDEENNSTLPELARPKMDRLGHKSTFNDLREKFAVLTR